MGYVMDSKQYLKHIRRIVNFPERVVRVDVNGCLVREMSGVHAWSFYRRYREARMDIRWAWAANDTP